METAEGRSGPDKTLVLSFDLLRLEGVYFNVGGNVLISSTEIDLYSWFEGGGRGLRDGSERGWRRESTE
jgi:hypothetical protein